MKTAIKEIIKPFTGGDNLDIKENARFYVQRYEILIVYLEKNKKKLFIQ
jgi:hypothetical protein